MLALASLKLMVLGLCLLSFYSQRTNQNLFTPHYQKCSFTWAMAFWALPTLHVSAVASNKTARI